MQKDAIKLMKSGEGKLKTGFFKWKPNFEEALPKFMEAVELFENCKDYANALKCYEKLALCYNHEDELSGEAECYEKMGMIHLKQQKDPKFALDLFNKAASLYKIHGNGLKAQELLKKLGRRCFEIDQDDLGAGIYKLIIDDLFEGQNYGTGSEIIPVYLDYLIKRDKYAESIEIYKRHIKYLTEAKKYEHIVARCWLGIICINIIMKEHYIAEENMSAFSAKITSIRSSDEYSAALNLIDSIQKGDSLAYAKVLKRPIFTQIETELVKKLKKYQLPSIEEYKKPAAKKNQLFGNSGKQKLKHAPVEEKKEVTRQPDEDQKTSTTESMPEEKFVPATKPTEEKPADKKAEDKKPEEKPAETKPEEKSAETKPEEKPADTKPEEKPAEAKTEEKPAEANENENQDDKDYGGMFT